MVAPVVASAMVTVCAEMYVPVPGLSDGVAAVGVDGADVAGAPLPPHPVTIRQLKEIARKRCRKLALNKRLSFISVAFLRL